MKSFILRKIKNKQIYVKNQKEFDTRMKKIRKMKLKIVNKKKNSNIRRIKNKIKEFLKYNIKRMKKALSIITKNSLKICGNKKL
jgi:hypothetical protein